jgi:alkylation response protein AidB-like acyl-CoA dehydrogenase
MTDDRTLLAESARDFLDRWSSSSAVRQALDADAAIDEQLWRRMAELGWPALLVSEDHGGAGASLADAVTIAEELGAHTAVAPFLSTAVLAPSAISASATANLALLPKLADGSCLAAVALSPAVLTGYETGAGLNARPNEDGYTIDGTLDFVPDLGVADFIVVGARLADGGMLLALIRSDAPGVSRTDVELMDLTRHAGSLHLVGVKVEQADVLADADAAAQIARAVLLRGKIILAADSVGAAKRALMMAVQYAKQRVQFDRPIGSFQAIKHRLADMFALTQVAAASVEQAAVLTEFDPESRLALSAASYALETAVRVVGDAIQVHGGIGFTWEHDCHLLLKRALLNEALLVTVQDLRECIASELLPRES